MIMISIAKDFTRFPSGRYKKNGETSGESFREKFLEPAIREGQEITVDFDGTVGYGSSFLEEAFGGLVRHLKMPSAHVLALLSLQSSDPSIKDEVIEYIQEAGKKL